MSAQFRSAQRRDSGRRGRAGARLIGIASAEMADMVGSVSEMAKTTMGLIAGNRSLPIEFARLARQEGTLRVVAVAFENETDPRIAEFVDEVVWLRVGQLDRMISAFAERGVRRCVMLGQIAPKNLFDLRPDLRAMRLLWRLKAKNAHTIFGAIAEELKKDGIELVEATPWLRPLMPGVGFRLGPALDADQESDVRFGFHIAKQISKLEIGQTVVVRRGTVLAVEAFEGTDHCLARGGALAGSGGGAVAVKVAKSGHDMRFDIPTVGSKTVEVCAENGVAVLAFEAGKTLVLEMEVVSTAAAKLGISVVAVEFEACQDSKAG
ncbi:MAG: UDP-2,3-diacylglucosamine diphosphatase LpxI [Verrucomicrobiota bacterium]|nr:UDP-2,3-diacylglucosamine diphosphatase LpxI [Verrucomicrobiota bacterium]